MHGSTCFVDDGSGYGQTELTREGVSPAETCDEHSALRRCPHVRPIADGGFMVLCVHFEVVAA
jgi:hypothetical protein